ncbi:hypothetical protein JCM10212_006620 [Sporobolomyces blumeae]
MASRRLVSLPVEVRHRIWLHLGAAIRLGLPRPCSPRTTFRTQSTAAFSSSLDLASAHPSIATSPRAPIFEPDNTPEYRTVPPSKLDSPSSVPRTPDESLLALLGAKSYSAASSLLDELEQNRQAVPTRYEFALHALKQLERQGVESDWSRWWALAPDVVDVPHDSVTNLRAATAVMEKRADKAATKLVRLLEYVVAESPDEARRGSTLKRTVEFGETLARQGHARVVSERLIRPVMVFGDVETATALWETTLGEMRRQDRSFGGQGFFLSSRSRTIRAEERKAGRELRAKVGEGRRHARTVSIERWFASRNRSAFKRLVAAREDVVRVQANLSNLETAVEVLLSTNAYPSLVVPSQPVKLSRPLFLSVLALLGEHDRFDLFELVYDALRHGGRRLTRVRQDRLDARDPYYIRGQAFDASDPEPSAQEAFMTFRDRHAVSSIEEGTWEDVATDAGSVDSDGLEATVDTGGFAKIGTDGAHYGRTTSRIESERLSNHVEKGRPDLAVSHLLKLFEHGTLPSAPSVARLITALAAHERGPEAVLAIDDHVQASYWQRGFWTTARMLADLEQGNLKLVVRRFRDYFLSSTLPVPVASAIKSVTLRVPSTREGTIPGGAVALKRTNANAYTVAILLQALVPLLERARAGAGSKDRLDEVYDALSDSASWQIVPVHTPPSPSSTLQRAAVRSPLDPYTFLPFVLSSIRAREPPLDTLGILDKMLAIGLRDIPPVLVSLALSAFARRGAFADFDYLLRAVEEGAVPHDGDPRARGGGAGEPVSQRVVEFVANLYPSTVSRPLEPVPELYATVLKSFRLRTLASTPSAGPPPSSATPVSERGKVTWTPESTSTSAIRVLERLVERIGPDGLRAWCDRDTVGARAFKDEVGWIGKAMR